MNTQELNTLYGLEADLMYQSYARRLLVRFLTQESANTPWSNSFCGSARILYSLSRHSEADACSPEN